MDITTRVTRSLRSRARLRTASPRNSTARPESTAITTGSTSTTTARLRLDSRSDTAPPADPESTNRRALPVALRLVATYALIVTATLLVVAGLAYDLTRHQLASDLDGQLRSLVMTYERAALPHLHSRDELVVRTKRWLKEQVVPPEGAIAVRTGRNIVR